MVEEGFSNIRSQKPSQRLICLPASIESCCSLPATDVKTLETLDSVLKTSETKTELVSLLTFKSNYSIYADIVILTLISGNIFIPARGQDSCRLPWQGLAKNYLWQPVLLYQLVRVCCPSRVPWQWGTGNYQGVQKDLFEPHPHCWYVLWYVWNYIFLLVVWF